MLGNISELKLIAHSLAASKGNAASFFQVSLAVDIPAILPKDK